MRASALALPLLVLLGACSGESGDSAQQEKPLPAAVRQAPVAGPIVESDYGTPVKDRVATLGLLNKRNNLTQDLVMKTGESRRIGNVVIKLATCEKSLPWESPPETGAFVQVLVEERARADEKLAWRKVFSGWLFKNSPSLNVVEHPVYDVWVKDCAMKFPGEEEEIVAPASSAAKPAASPKAASPSAAPAAAAPAPAPAAPPAESSE